ncbi:MAG TPA: hypothetical protein VJK73_01705 [Candidatus Paceibacterota bacterium]
MSLSYKKSLVIIVAGLVYLAGQYFRGAWFPHLTWPFPCHEITFGTSTYCDAAYLETLGWPLITLGQMLAIVWFLIWLANERTYRLWLKVSAVYIPTAVILSFLIYPIRFAPGTPISPVSYGIYPFGALYILITLVVVLIGWWRGRRAKPV